jgi:flavin-dependent dehydrogenase
MAVGDAAGLVDPVTGEGLYYAIRSGDLAAENILNRTGDLQHKPWTYKASLQEEFVEDLTFGSGLAHRFFLEQVLYASVPARMIECMRISPRLMEIVQDLFSGTQGYLDLKKRLLENLNGTVRELLFGSILGNRVVREGR